MEKFNNVSILSYSMEGVEDFFKVYSNLPLDERSNVVVVLNGKSISWNLASQEIKNNTENGKIILKTLKELGII